MPGDTSTFCFPPLASSGSPACGCQIYTVWGMPLSFHHTSPQSSRYLITWRRQNLSAAVCMSRLFPLTFHRTDHCQPHCPSLCPGIPSQAYCFNRNSFILHFDLVVFIYLFIFSSCLWKEYQWPSGPGLYAWFTVSDKVAIGLLLVLLQSFSAAKTCASFSFCVTLFNTLYCVLFSVSLLCSSLECIVFKGA